jgi:Protein of unknown function (DUF3224)
MFRRTALVVVALVLVGLPARAQAPASPLAPKETPVKQVARGTFIVKLTPGPATDDPAVADLGRMTIDKLFHGDIEGTSKGEMLTAGTATKGSAGYVAMERVTGSLQGRKGSFILQHTATMSRGVPWLSISVVPDSGTGQLLGITGTLSILIENGEHSYVFEYTIDGAK